MTCEMTSVTFESRGIECVENVPSERKIRMQYGDAFSSGRGGLPISSGSGPWYELSSVLRRTAQLSGASQRPLGAVEIMESWRSGSTLLTKLVSIGVSGGGFVRMPSISFRLVSR